MKMSEKEALKIMGLTKDFSPAELITQYRKLARERHPDKNKAEDTTQQFQELGNAYECLKSATAPEAPAVSQKTTSSSAFQQRTTSTRRYSPPVEVFEAEWKRNTQAQQKEAEEEFCPS